MNPNGRSRATGTALLLVALLAGLLTPAVHAVTPAASHTEIVAPPLPAFVIPKPERVQLKNGMVLLLLPDRSLPLVSGSLLVRTGGRLEPANKAGLASLTGSVMRTGGTRKWSGDEIDDRLEAIGARVETGIGSDQGRAGFSCLAPDLDAVLAVVASVLREPVFAQEKLDVARSQARAGIARRNDDVQGIARREFAKLVYGKDSAYTRQVEYATLDSIGRDDLVAFHAAHFHPNRALLGLTGDFDPKAVRKLVEKHFGSWARGPEAKPFTGGYRESTSKGLHFVEKSDVNQSSIVLGHLGIRTDHPDYYAVSVLNEVLGGGFSSRLFTSVRSKKGLAYSVGGGVFDDFDHPGTFRIGLMTKSGSTVAGLEAVWEEIEKIRAEAPVPEEIQRAREAILSSFVFNFDSRSKILERQLAYEYYGYPLDFLDRYRAGIEQVTAEQVLAAARKHMRPEEVVRLVVGKAQDFDRPLAELGPVATIDIAIPPPAGAALAPATPQARTRGRAGVERAIAAMGGAPALGAIAALRSVGEARVTTPMGQVVMKSSVLWQAPDRIRQERQTPSGTMTLVLSGGAGVAITPMGNQEVPAAQAAEALASIHRSLPILLGDRGLEAQHLGTEAGLERVRVKARGVDVVLWLDAEGRVARDSYSGTGLGGAPAEIARVYSDWRQVGGVTVPFVVEATADGKPFQSVSYTAIEINPPIDPGSFEKPVPAAP